MLLLLLLVFVSRAFGAVYNDEDLRSDYLRYHGRWVFMKDAKNNLQKNLRKTICESLETSYDALTALIKIHRQLSHVMRIAV